MTSSAALPERSASGYQVERTTEHFRGPIFSVHTDSVQFPDGSTADRDIVRHVGAVGIVALDEQRRVVLLSQYRHAVGAFLWELPAGVLDHKGEDPLEAAKRELAEEVGLQAQQWHTLVDIVSAPGFCDERVRVYLAEGLSENRLTDFTQEHEEADLVVTRVPLADCVGEVLSGAVQNSIAVAGISAAAIALEGRMTLRAAEAPWPGRG